MRMKEMEEGRAYCSKDGGFMTLFMDTLNRYAGGHAWRTDPMCLCMSDFDRRGSPPPLWDLGKGAVL